jgi:hypothetical protein
VLDAIPASAQFALVTTGAYTRAFETARMVASVIDGFRGQWSGELARSRGWNSAQLASNPLVIIAANGWVTMAENLLRGGLNVTREQLLDTVDGTAALALLAIPDDSNVLGVNLLAGAWFGVRDEDSARAVLAGIAGLLDSFGVDSLPYDAESARIGGGTPWAVLVTHGLLYAGSDALELETKETFVAVPRLSELLEDVPLLEGATDLAWVNTEALRDLLSSTLLEVIDRNQFDGTASALLSLTDGLLISARVSPDVTVIRFGMLLH